MRNVLILVAVVATIHSGRTVVAADTAAKRPNVIFVVGDDMGYADVGFHACTQIPMPHLDRLAKSGVQWTNGYVSGPYCSPTRAGLLTGRYQQRFGHEFNPSGPKTGLPLAERTIADRFGDAGYTTGLVGKWHLGSAPLYHPLRRGFDEFYGFLGGANAYLPKEGDTAVPNIWRGTERVEENGYLTDAFGREAVAFVERHKEKPFFLYLAFNAVHTPMHADDARLAKFAAIEDPQRRAYAAMMSAMDDAIGSLIAKLRAEGLEENTLIAFISDNGGPTMPTTTVNGAVNDPFRGSKRQTLEGGVHVAFIVSWKGHLPAGVMREEPVIQLDLQPTALAAAGIEYSESDRFDGVNLLPYLTGEKSGKPHEALFWRFGEQTAVRKGDWKLVRYGRDPDIDANESWPKLYNLASDIGESNDLANEHPEVVQELEAAWQKWNSTNVPPLWSAQGRNANKIAE